MLWLSKRTQTLVSVFTRGAFCIFLMGACHAVQAQTSAPAAEKLLGDTFPISDELQTPEQLFQFIEEVANTEPEETSEDAMIAHQRKLARTVVLVGDKVLELDSSVEEAMQATYFKLQALRLLVEIDEPGADSLFAKAVDIARNDERSDVAAVGMKFFVETGFRKWSTWGESEKLGMAKAIVGFIKQGEAGPEHLQLMLTMVDFLTTRQDEQIAKRMLDELTPHFSNSKDEIVLGMLERVKGIGRRLNLPGNQMELTGTLLDGSPLDWESYRGKVVLVDFWATWCGPCRAEVPNVLQLYQAYHEKGFEVLGISLDTQRSDAEAYIQQMQLPWATVFSEDKEQRGWEHPLAVYYGISGIPRAILVDQKGNVVHMEARGGQLARELRRLLGEPLAQSPGDEDLLVK